eukprot:gene3750-6076_t
MGIPIYGDARWCGAAAWKEQGPAVRKDQGPAVWKDQGPAVWEEQGPAEMERLDRGRERARGERALRDAA